MIFTKNREIKQSFDLKLDDRTLKIIFRQSKRTNKIMIKDLYPKGFEVVYPQYCTIEKARDFFMKHYEWVCFHAKKKPQTSEFEDHSIISLLGEELIIEYTNNPRGLVSINNQKLIIPGSPENSKTKIKNFLKSYLLENIKVEADIFAKQIGKSFKKITIADFKSKWGSCSIDSSLTFNLKLVFAPKLVMIYVIAHEVAHLCEMNHSKQFWEVVKQLQPGFEVHRRWLKHNNHFLKKYIL
jgi:predicted metal-dependent hydrolase